MRRHMIRLLLVLAAATAIASFFVFDLQRYLSLAELKSQRDALASYAQMRPLVTIGIYFIAYVVMAAFSLPGAAIMTLAGGAVFGLARRAFAHRPLSGVSHGHAGADHRIECRCRWRRDHHGNHFREPPDPDPRAQPDGCEDQSAGQHRHHYRGTVPEGGAGDGVGPARLRLPGDCGSGGPGGDRRWSCIYHIDRGYECIEEKPSSYGACIRRVAG